MQQDYLQIGEIVRPQGIRGEVNLRAMTEDMTRYARKRCFSNRMDSMFRAALKKAEAMTALRFCSWRA